MRRAPRRSGVGCLAVPLLFFAAVGAALWGWDAWRLLRWRPVPAVVTASSVREVRGSKGSLTYRPRVEYRYSAAGGSHVGTEALAGGESRGRDWAESIAERFAPGTRTRAFVDPDDPTRAYLLRRPSPGVYVFLVAPLVLLAALSLDDGEPTDPDPPAPAPDGEGRWTVAPLELPADARAHRARQLRLRAAVAVAILLPYLALATVTAAGEPGIVAPVRSLVDATVGDGFFLFEAIAVAAVVWFARRRHQAAADVAPRVRGVALTLDRAALRAGEDAEVELRVATAPPAGDGRLERAALGVLRMAPDARGKLVRSTVWQPLLGGAAPPSSGDAPRGVELLPGEPTRADGDVTGRCTLRLAPDAGPTDGKRAWTLLVHLAFADGRDWELAFPVRVHAAGGG